MPHFEARATVQLPGEESPQLHEFFFDDTFGGDVGKAKEYFQSLHKTATNVRVVPVGTRRTISSPPKVLPPTKTDTTALPSTPASAG